MLRGLFRREKEPDLSGLLEEYANAYSDPTSFQSMDRVIIKSGLMSIFPYAPLDGCVIDYRQIEDQDLGNAYNLTVVVDSPDGGLILKRVDSRLYQIAPPLFRLSRPLEEWYLDESNIPLTERMVVRPRLNLHIGYQSPMVIVKIMGDQCRIAGRLSNGVWGEKTVPILCLRPN